MGRPVVLSNGEMFIGINENGLVHDFYYPYVGLENLANARGTVHKVGVWVDNKFSWTDDGTWDIHLDIESDALVSNIICKNTKLGITLKYQDFIDCDENVFIRRISITNEDDQERDVRLFMHQVFEISRRGRADTALYVPEDNFILDYKGRYSLAISGKFEDGSSFDQWAVGLQGIEGKLGTFVDAEDGELSFNPVEHGGVDSTIRFRNKIGGNQSTLVNYWIIAASSQSDVQSIDFQLKKANIEEMLIKNRQHWQKWIHSSDFNKPTFNRRSLDHSLLFIKAHIDDRGSILASGDSSIFNYGRDYYCYCWPRDAVYALLPLVSLHYYDEVKSFIEFARDTKHKDGYLMHKYQPDRSIGSTWHPLIHGKSRELAIQEDETASVIFLIGEYYKESQDKVFIEHIYHSFVLGAASFMSKYIDTATGLPHASYDLWEQKFLTNTYTVCIVIAAFESASMLASELDLADDAFKWSRQAEKIRNNLDKLYSSDGYFVKGFLLSSEGNLDYDNTLDISSLYGVYAYSGLDINDERILSTLEHVEKKILNQSPSGGVIRYANDNYFLNKPYPGNPWIVTTLWLAQVYIGLDKKDKARELLDWAISRELSTGALSEQFDPENRSPLGVNPLVWSHAEVIKTILDLT